MKKTLSFLFVGVLSLGAAFAQNKRSAVPSKILSARTVYVDNQTTDASMQNEALMGINKWGRFEIAETAQKADVVLRLIGSAVVKVVPAGGMPSGNAAVGMELAPPGCTRVEVVDPKSGSVLWAETRKSENAKEKSLLVEGLHSAVDQQEKNHR